MNDKEKQVLINKLKHKETGDIATQDDDLTKSEAYKSKQQIFKDKYKDYYDDVKLHIKEDW